MSHTRFCLIYNHSKKQIMNHKLLQLCCAAVLVLGVVSCKKKDDDNVVPTGTVTMRFSNKAGNQLLSLGNTTYVTPQNDSIVVDKFNYYISNIRLNSTSQVYIETESYHLIRQDQPSSLQFSLPYVPNGTYGSVTLTIGVDSARNVSGAQTGALDPLNDMFWTWSTGYIMGKLEGSSPQSGAADKSFVFHIGGFGGAHTGIRTVTLNFPQPLTVESGHASNVYLHADALKWFAPGNVDLGSLYFLMAVNSSSAMIADNYSQMLVVDSVRH